MVEVTTFQGDRFPNATQLVLTEIEFRGVGFHDYLSKFATICCIL